MTTQELMHKSRSGFLAEILARWTSLAEILVIAICAALGVDLVAHGLILHWGVDPIASLVIGLLLCSFSLLILVGRVTSRRTRSQSYTGFFIYNRNSNKLVLVPRYGFSEALSRYLEAALSENKALKLIWDKEPLRESEEIERRKAKGKSKEEMLEMWQKLTRGRSYQLIREATEYFVLDRLSTHLTDYFNDEQFRKENLKEFRRDDVPDVLLKNRFLELFSKPMEERAAFIGKTEGREDWGETVAAFTEGAIYERFDLVLPKESIVRRVSRIEIETNAFLMNLVIHFDGMGAVIPTDFLEYYLSIHDPLNVTTEFAISIEVTVSFKFGALLFGLGWNYYHWIDSFLQLLDERVSEETFSRSIGWDAALTVIKSLNIKSK
jgi:hypothetical protein